MTDLLIGVLSLPEPTLGVVKDVDDFLPFLGGAFAGALPFFVAISSTDSSSPSTTGGGRRAGMQTIRKSYVSEFYDKFSDVLEEASASTTSRSSFSKWRDKSFSRTPSGFSGNCMVSRSLGSRIMPASKLTMSYVLLACGVVGCFSMFPIPATMLRLSGFGLSNLF